MNEDQTALLIDTHKAVNELTEHLRNAMLDNDKRDEAFTLIQLGFQNNVAAQARIGDSLLSIAKDTATLKERSITTVVLASIVPVMLLAIGLLTVAARVAMWLAKQPAPLAMLGWP